MSRNGRKGGYGRKLGSFGFFASLVAASLLSALIWQFIPGSGDESHYRPDPGSSRGTAGWARSDGVTPNSFPFPRSYGTSSRSRGAGTFQTSRSSSSSRRSPPASRRTSQSRRTPGGNPARDAISGTGPGDAAEPGPGGELVTSEGARSTADMMARAAELRQFERDYQAAWSQFGTGLSRGNPYMNARNPFRRAFLDRADPNDVVGDDPSDGGGDTGDPSTGTTPPPEMPNPPPTPPPAPPGGPDPGPPAPRPPPFRPGGGLVAPDPRFDFVVVGDYGAGGSARRVYRGRRDARNQFFLENDRTFTIGPNPEGYRVFDEDEMVVVVDLNQDGHLDLVQAMNGPLGALLETEIGDGSGQFELQAQGYLLRRQVLNLALFDFSDDGEVEIVMVTDVGPGLTIYTRDGGQLVPFKELAMTFTPGIVMTSNIRPHDKRLYILDRDMTQAIYYSTLFHDGRPRRLYFPGHSLHTLEMENSDGEDGREVLVYEDIVSFGVFETTEQGHVLYASFPAPEYAGLIIVGDYFRLNSRQMVIWW